MASLTPAGSAGAASGHGAEAGAGVSAFVAKVFRDYVTLSTVAAGLGRRDLAHQLVLCEPLSMASESPLIAASIASAASLSIEHDPAMVRQSTRSGAIDFTVNSLDEALRALKNEVRKGLSIAICLEADPQAVFEEMIMRGVQPDMVCVQGLRRQTLSMQEAIQILLARGARAVSFAEDGQPVATPGVLPGARPAALLGTVWRVGQLPGKWLPMVDEVVASCLPASDQQRRDWLKRAPRYLGRALRTQRYLPLTAGEIDECGARLRMHQAEAAWEGINLQVETSEGAALFTL